MRTVGFTGTRGGMTHPQREEVRRLLYMARKRGHDSFVFGLCVGADEESALDARDLGFTLIGRPGYPVGHPYRSRLPVDVLYPVEPPLDRNAKIALDGREFVAAPISGDERIPSGTWATIRRIRQTGRPLSIVTRTGALLV